MEKLHIPYICARCALPFTEADNIGKWYCAWHPGYVNHDNRWSCCNIPYEQKALPIVVKGMPSIHQYVLTTHADGCDPADHHPSSPYFEKDENPIQSMPRWIKNQVMPYNNTVTEGDLPGTYKVFRTCKSYREQQDRNSKAVAPP